MTELELFCELYTKLVKGRKWLDEKPRPVEMVDQYIERVIIPMRDLMAAASDAQRAEYNAVILAHELMGCSGSVRFRRYLSKDQADTIARGVLR